MIDAGRSDEHAKAVEDLVFNLQNGDPVLEAQFNNYSEVFGNALKRTMSRG